MTTLTQAVSQLRSHHAVAVLGAGLSASQYPMTANLPPLVWMALDADPPTRTRVAAQIGSRETTAKAIVSSDAGAMEIAWREIAASPRTRRVFQSAFADLDLEREPTTAHFALAQMIRASVVEYVVSFNWDTALERAYEHLYGVEVPAQTLLKPHGDASQPDIPWVLPHEDGVLPEKVRTHLAHLASSRPRVFMIIGYSGSDPVVVRELIKPYEQTWPVIRIGPNFTDPEAITGTAEEILPALTGELQLNAGLRHWRNVTFDRQRSLSAALMGYRLGPNDVDCCPQLPGLRGIVSRVRAARFVAVTGPSGSGKSISAFQAARQLNKEGWSVLELMNPGTASDSAVQEFVTHPGHVLAVVDDAQSIDSSAIRGFERAASEDRAVILCITSWATPLEQVSIAGKQAVDVLAEFCSAKSRELTDLVARLDDRVGYGPFYEQIDRRISLAREAEFPWQFMQTLSGGDRRLREELHELQADGYTALMGLIALRQITSLDEGITPTELSSQAGGIGFDIDDVATGLAVLRQRRLIFERDERIRLPHIRFAVSALKELFNRPAVDPAPTLLQVARTTLLSEETTDRGRLWLVDAVRTDALRYTHLLVDADVQNLLIENLFASDESSRGVRSELLWEAHWGHNPLPDAVWAQISEAMPNWILEATDRSAYGLRWLLNGLRGHSKELHQRACVSVGLGRLVNRMIGVGTGKYVAGWEELCGEICQVDWDTLQAWSITVDTDVDLQRFENWVRGEAAESESLHGWAGLAQTLWVVSPAMVQAILVEIEPMLVRKFETDPTAAHGMIFDWYLGFLGLLTESGRDPDDDDGYRDVREIYRRLMLSWIGAVDWSKVGRTLSDCHPSDLHNFAMLAYVLSKVDQAKLDQMCHSVTTDMFEALPNSYWQNGLWRDRDFIAVLSASSDSEPGRSLLQAHRDQISDIAPWAIAVIPELAISLDAGHVHLQHGGYSFHWQECAEAIEAVAALDRDAAAAILDANREQLAKKLSAAEDYSGQEFGQFARVVDSVDPGWLDGLVADLDMAEVAPHWLKRLDDAGEGATVVRALLERVGVMEENFISTYRDGDAVDS
jgi:hypothetical protein